jgi:hypothetical protein
MNVYDLIMTESSLIEPTARGYENENDNQSVLKLSDMRKTRLTLGQLNKLRQMNDVRKIEFEQKLKKLSSQYKPPAQDPGGM